MIKFRKALNESLSLDGFVGVNQRHTKINQNTAKTLGGLNTPGFYNLGNAAAGLETFDETSHIKENSVFGTVSLGYNSMLFVDITGRQDYSSSLWSTEDKKENTSWFYPSATLSYVFSESLEVDWLTFGKARFGWARVGRGARDAYLTTPSYIVNPNYGSSPNASVPNSLYNPDLLPEITNGWEAGIEAGVLNDRVRVDFTYYSQKTEDLIFDVTMSAASGYSKQTMNAGTIENKGIEIMLGLTPVTNENLTWDIGFNWAKNSNVLVELNDDIETLRLTSLFGVALEAREGEPLFTFMGYDFQYDDAGNKLVDENGVYLTTDEIVPIGSTQADWTGGVNSTLSYKGIQFYFLIDMQKGGTLHSYSNQWGKYSGMLSETVENNIREDGIVVEGVYAPGTVIDDVDVSGQANATTLDAQSHFFLNQGYVVHAADQYDATFVKLREMRLSYRVPQEITENWPIFNVELSVYGRNLAILHSNVPHVDPEAAVSASNIQGFEGGQLPTERTFGISLGFNL
jgi:hypothetical protein